MIKRKNEIRMSIKLLFVILSTIILLFCVPQKIHAASNNWSWPTSIHSIKSDWPNYSSGKYHGGTDFPVALNSPVYSTCDGEVVAVTTLTSSYGKHIKIRANVNGDTVYIRYCHLNSFAVSVGEQVVSGQLIGYSGSTGNSTGPHLHYEVRNANDRYGNSSSPNLNPRNFLPGTSYTFETIKEPEPTVPPTNATISKNQVWYDLSDTIELTMYANNATSYYLSMFKDGQPIVSESIESGHFTMAASKLGIGSYSAYCAGINSLGSVDSAWISFDVVGAPGCNSISSTQKYYNISDTVSISVEPICSKGQVIGIDKNGSQRVVTQDCGTTYSISASSLGVGKYSAYFSVYNGSGTYDTERVEFEIVDMLSDAAITNLGNEFYAYIEHQSGTYLMPQNYNIIGGIETGEENQIWKFTRLQNGAYKVQNLQNGGYMTIEDGRDQDATNVIISSNYTGKTNQQFYFYNQCGGIYIRPLSSEKRVLNINSYAKLELWYFGTDWTPQKFNIIKLDKQYTISYDSNGGTEAPENQIKTERVSLELHSEKPQKTYVITYNANGGIISEKNQQVNAVFEKWNTKSDGTGESYYPGSKYSNDKDLLLYAIWKNPRIEFLKVPTKKGYTFVGWYTNIEGGQKITENTILTENITIYAHWIQNVLPGDVNGDGMVNSKDSVMLRKYILDGISINEEAADVNDDGKIGTADSVLLRKYILGENIELK